MQVQSQVLGSWVLKAGQGVLQLHTQVSGSIVWSDSQVFRHENGSHSQKLEFAFISQSDDSVGQHFEGVSSELSVHSLTLLHSWTVGMQETYPFEHVKKLGSSQAIWKRN